MIKIQFTGARVFDGGYGLIVNGKSLNEILSTALGTKVDHHYGYDSGLPDFESDNCDITIIIDPKPQVEIIETGDELWHSVEEMEECKREQYKEKAGEAES